MRPFDLGKAEAGDDVVTGDKSRARIICTNRNDKEYPVIALIKSVKGHESVKTYTRDGIYNTASRSDYDLFMATVKKTAWINIYPSVVSTTKYNSKEDALSVVGDNVVDTIKIEWEQ